MATTWTRIEITRVYDLDIEQYYWDITGSGTDGAWQTTQTLGMAYEVGEYYVLMQPFGFRPRDVFTSSEHLIAFFARRYGVQPQLLPPRTIIPSKPRRRSPK